MPLRLIPVRCGTGRDGIESWLVESTHPTIPFDPIPCLYDPIPNEMVFWGRSICVKNTSVSVKALWVRHREIYCTEAAQHWFKNQSLSLLNSISGTVRFWMSITDGTTSLRVSIAAHVAFSLAVLLIAIPSSVPERILKISMCKC